VRIDQASELLKPGYLPLETGYLRLEDGRLLAAVLNRVIGCNAEMILWWLKRRKSQDEFKRWHPAEHVSMDYRDGFTFAVHDRGGQRIEARLEEQDPSVHFDAAKLANSDISGISCSRGGPAGQDFWAMHVIHVMRDTDWGCEVKTRFWLGDIDPPKPQMTPEIRAAMFPDDMAEWQIRHASEEYMYLAGFLPDLYQTEAK